VIWLSALGPARITGTLLTIALFTALCAGTFWRERRRQRAERHLAASLLPSEDASPPLLIVHASQTGTAEQLAWQTARALQLAGVSAQVSSLACGTRAVHRQHLRRR
jgi:sulfite reductase (NADPH) flavoprotein alpha-component